MDGTARLDRAVTLELLYPRDYACGPKGVALFSFPPFRLDLAEERLWKADAEVRVRRKPFAILKYLVEHPRRLVTHDEIVAAVWGKVAMSESLVRTHVRDLRQALGEELIETVVGRGYRFLADVSEVDGQPAADRAPDKSAGAADAVIGRQAELERLEAALRAAKERRRSLAFVTGDAGIGKTKLIDAFVEVARARTRVWVLRGTCVEQYGSGEAYLPVLEALGSLCRSSQGERVVETLVRHAPTWLVQMPGLLSDERFDELQRRSAGAGQPRMLRELAETLEVLSGDAPVILTLDDLQWSDPSTVDLVAMLARRREPARLFVIASYRPAELAAGHPLTRVADELVAHRQAASLRLEPFDRERLDAYLAHRFPGHEFPEGLTATIHGATGGNPLFIATLVDDLVSRRMIREADGGWELAASVEEVAAQRPDGIRRLIDTQIDRFAVTEQRILEAASVAGLSFAVGVVAHALDASVDEVDAICETLADERRLLRHDGTETWPDGSIHSRYAFVHGLFQNAALARNASPAIRLWHQRIAERLESGHAGELDEIAAELALHFAEARVFAKAAPHAVLAGERAVARHGYREAQAHFERAQRLLARLPQGRETEALELRIALGLARCLFVTRGLGAPELVPTLERAIELATRLQDDERLAVAWTERQKCLLLQGDCRGAGELAERTMAVVDRSTDPIVRSTARISQAVAAFSRGRLAETEEHIERARAVLGTDAPSENAAVLSTFDTLLLWLTGRPEQAIAQRARTLEMAEAVGDPFLLAHTLWWMAIVHVFQREPEPAAELAARALRLATEADLPWIVERATPLAFWARSELEPDDAAAAKADAWSARPAEAGLIGWTALAVTFVLASANAGRRERALAAVASALEFVAESDERFMEPELHRLRGELVAQVDTGQAERCFLTALDVARQQGSVAFELRAAVSLVRHVAGAKRKRAKEDLRRLIARYGATNTADVADARALLSD